MKNSRHNYEHVLASINCITLQNGRIVFDILFLRKAIDIIFRLGITAI